MAAKDVAHVEARIADGAAARLARLPGMDLVFVALNLADPTAPEAGWSDTNGDAERDEGEPVLRQVPHPVLGDVEVRSALASAIDYERVIYVSAFGEASRVPADVPPASA